MKYQVTVRVPGRGDGDRNPTVLAETRRFNGALHELETHAQMKADKLREKALPGDQVVQGPLSDNRYAVALYGKDTSIVYIYDIREVFRK